MQKGLIGQLEREAGASREHWHGGMKCEVTCEAPMIHIVAGQRCAHDWGWTEACIESPAEGGRES